MKAAPIIRIVFILLTVVILSIGCGEYIINKVGDVVFGGFQPSIYNDIIVCAFMIVSVILIYKWNVDKRKRMTIGIMAATIFVFCAVCRVNHGTLLVSTAICDNIKYSDVTILLSILLLVKLLIDKTIKCEAPSEESEIYVDSLDVEDVLSRKSEADVLAKRLIQNRNRESATGVAITGSWGIGKSYFLNLLEKKFRKQNQIVFYFNPWNCNENELVTTFFEELETHVNHDGLVTSIRRYARLLKKSESTFWNVLSAFISADTLSTRYEQVRELMKQLSQPVFVLMDDCDRLGKEDMKKAISLIRNVANFPNLVLIAAFDEEKTKRFLGLDDGDSYLNKMFNLNHPLLPLSNENILGYIVPIVKAKFKNTDAYTTYRIQESKESHEVYPIIDQYPQYNYFSGIKLNEFLPTFREVKRYLNLLLDDYSQMKDITDNINFNNADFVLLELIKYKDIELYLTLRDNPSELLDLKIQKAWMSPNYELKDVERNGGIGEILKALFKRDIFRDNPFSICSVTYYPCYFSKTLPKNIITKTEFSHLYDEGVDYELILKDWIKSGKQNFLSMFYGKERNMYFADVIQILANYVYNFCDNLKTSNTFLLASRGLNGNVKEYRHSYEVISNVVSNNPIIWEICFQTICEDPDEKSTEKLDEFLKNTDYKLELIAIFLREIRELDSSDGAYMESEPLFFQLWNDYVDSINDYDAQQTANVIQILHDCLLPEVTEKAIVPLLKKNLKHWIGRTVIKLRSGGQDYLFLDDFSLRALFETYDKARMILQNVKSTNTEDIPLIDEYLRMLTYFYGHGRNVRADDLEENKFLLLSQLPQQLFAVQPFHTLARGISNDFWDCKTFRKYEKVEYYFANK